MKGKMFLSLTLLFLLCVVEVPEVKAESDLQTRVQQTIQGWKEVTLKKKFKKFRPQMSDFIQDVVEVIEMLGSECSCFGGPEIEPEPQPEIGSGNIAYGQPATQISDYPGGPAEKAVDGNANPDWSGSSCTHTVGGEFNPWWQVDLGKYYKVARVAIVNRRDCCHERLNNVRVEVGSPGNMHLCGIRAAAGPGEKFELLCPTGTAGQFVKVSMNNQDYLTLCEVQVFSN